MTCFGALAKSVIGRIGRPSTSSGHGDELGFLAKQIDDRTNKRAAHSQPREHALILVQNFLGNEPREGVLLNPTQQEAGTWSEIAVPRGAEAGYTGNQNRSVNDASESLSSSRNRQR